MEVTGSAIGQGGGRCGLWRSTVGWGGVLPLGDALSRSRLGLASGELRRGILGSGGMLGTLVLACGLLLFDISRIGRNRRSLLGNTLRGLFARGHVAILRIAHTVPFKRAPGRRLPILESVAQIGSVMAQALRYGNLSDRPRALVRSRLRSTGQSMALDVDSASF